MSVTIDEADVLIGPNWVQVGEQRIGIPPWLEVRFVRRDWGLCLNLVSDGVHWADRQKKSLQVEVAAPELAKHIDNAVSKMKSAYARYHATNPGNANTPSAEPKVLLTDGKVEFVPCPSFDAAARVADSIRQSVAKLCDTFEKSNAQWGARSFVDAVSPLTAELVKVSETLRASILQGVLDGR